MSASKAKGTRWESAIIDYLRASGVPHAERMPGGMDDDRGDIAGIPGVAICTLDFEGGDDVDEDSNAL